MYFKVTKNKELIDLLQNIIYVKYQLKHNQILMCDAREAEAILSSDGKYGWHIEGLFNFKPDNSKYTVTRISKFEFDSLAKNMMKGD